MATLAERIKQLQAKQAEAEKRAQLKKQIEDAKKGLAALRKKK